jgi:hypothetical protein
MKPALLIAAAVVLSGCGYLYPADNRARSAVEAMNLTDVHLTRTMLGLNCGRSDKIHYKFSAHNLAGRTIHGVVCMSYLKGATVRITG